MTDPLQRYRTLLDERERERALWSRRELRVSWSRLAVMVVILAVAWLAVQDRVLSLWWVLLPVAGFLALISLHERLLRRRQRAELGCAYYRQGIDRLEGRWREAEGETGRDLRPEHHLYADDLDVFGAGSLYHLLNRTRTRAGEETLAAWLSAPASLEEATARQVAVAELMADEGLREDLATLGTEVRSELDPDRLATWAGREPLFPRPLPWRLLLAGLASANVVCAGLWLAGLATGRPMALTCTVSFGVFLALRSRIAEAIGGVERTSRDLTVIAELLDRLHEQPFRAPWLQERAATLRPDDVRPGQAIRRLQKWVQRVESRRNAFFAPFAAILLWTTQIAFLVEAWRDRHGARVVEWLRIVGEIEAASSLGTFGYERGVAGSAPEGGAELVFPVLRDGQPGLRAEGLGHPLIDDAARVRNDIALAVSDDAEAPPQTLVISGSNMSGKSTFLRSCGLNVVLAFAGAPVVARSMEASPLSVGASIRIQDSLQEGASKFYAEIQRLRQVLDLARERPPALCLLDEILHGTNSHDRRIGAAAVVQALMRERALVLVTTHDLALARMTEAEDFEGGRRLRNVHFVDSLEDGRIRFDYRLRPGIVDRSNALALMREVGLDV